MVGEGELSDSVGAAGWRIGVGGGVMWVSGDFTFKKDLECELRKLYKEADGCIIAQKEDVGEGVSDCFHDKGDVRFDVVEIESVAVPFDDFDAVGNPCNLRRFHNLQEDGSPRTL